MAKHHFVLILPSPSFFSKVGTVVWHDYRAYILGQCTYMYILAIVSSDVISKFLVIFCCINVLNYGICGHNYLDLCVMYSITVF